MTDPTEGGDEPVCPRCGGPTDPEWWCSLGLCPECCVETDEKATSIATASYRSWRPEHGTPVRTSVGEPRFWRGPDLELARSLAPFGIFGQLTGDAARTAYLAGLDSRAHEVVAELAAIARRHPGRRLVLLCFEPAGRVCHRRWAAGWLGQRLGLDVPELPAEPEPGGRLF